MGFGFNLFFIFILIPLTIGILLVWGITRKVVFGKILLLIWTVIVGFVLMMTAFKFFTNKKELDRSDIYGHYIIDRTKFPGEQADWQYNHFRFEITEDDSIFFYETEGKKIINTYKGTIKFHSAYKQPRLIIQVEEPSHHIIEDNPILYRTVWSFYYVFNSQKYYNVFFKKGKWEPIGS